MLCMFGIQPCLADNDQNGTTGLVLNRRTGYLVGDLAIDSAGFKIQPVHLGGTAPSQVCCDCVADSLMSVV